MIVIEPKVTFTKADVECIKNFANMCRVFGFNPWYVIEAVENNKRSLDDVKFEYEGANEDV